LIFWASTSKTINRLEGLGLQRLKIPLPKIIVLGEQSTGKSSIIEAISEIKTPRSTGTCTRCPLFIKLESPTDPNAAWAARVTLRRTFKFEGKKGRGSDKRFPGWVQQPETNTVDFMSSENPEKLEEIIVRAQRAVTSPLIDYEEFTKPSIDHLKDVHACTFSPNVVCISISHPGLPALSFYDLPGIIGQSDIPEDVTFVRNLVIEYVKDPEALILVTCSMESDIANSTAGGLARSLKAIDRCIGMIFVQPRRPPLI
jgi:GTPase SAR1 family protein